MEDHSWAIKEAVGSAVRGALNNGNPLYDATHSAVDYAIRNMDFSEAIQAGIVQAAQMGLLTPDDASQAARIQELETKLASETNRANIAERKVANNKENSDWCGTCERGWSWVDSKVVREKDKIIDALTGAVDHVRPEIPPYPGMASHAQVSKHIPNNLWDRWRKLETAYDKAKAEVAA